MGNITYLFMIFYLKLILQSKSIYYLSFEVYKVDYCILAIKKNGGDSVFSRQHCWRHDNVPNSDIFQKEYNFGDEYSFRIVDNYENGYIGVVAKINEYNIYPSLQKFWRCSGCITDDGNYIYDSNSNIFRLNRGGGEQQKKYYYMHFKINTKEELITLNDIVNKNYYTINEANIIYINPENFNDEIVLINFKDKNNFYVTHNKAHIIPFENIYFSISFDIENNYPKSSGKLMGYKFNTKKYEELNKNTDTFQINEEYDTLNYIFSQKEKDNLCAHIKFKIIAYNNPDNLPLSQTVSNSAIFEFHFCPNNTSICDSDFYLNCIPEFICYEHCPTKKNISLNKCEYCHPDCITCEEEIFTKNNTRCKSCFSDKKFLYLGNCVSECKNGYYIEVNETNIKRCKCDLENCFSCSRESLNKNNSCVICNKEKGYFPKFEEIKNNNDNSDSFIKCYKSPERYYLDKENEYYKLCYDSCQECVIGGNDTYHNCIKCKINYNYEIQYEEYKNCYINCSYYYYYDIEAKKYYCTKYQECPEKYNKLINGKKECIDECNKISRYQFRNICYTECPKDTFKSENKSFFCEVICYEDKPLELINKQECVDSCSIKLMKNNLCIIKYFIELKKSEEYEENNNEEKNKAVAQDKIIKNIENEMTGGDYDTSDIEKGEDDIFEDEKMKITITTTKNQKDNDNTNMTSINLGDCEISLRKAYNIPKDKLLYMKIIDVPLEGMKISKIEYDVYCKLNGTNLVRLNLSICENDKIGISIPVVLSEDIDKLNSSSDYYNDLCYISTSDSGTDISLKDRKKEFIKKNKTVCQDGCKFTDYDYKNNKAKCSCEVKQSSFSFMDINIDTEKLNENFVNIKNIANIHLLYCYKTLFNKKGIIKNIGFYISTILIIFHTILIILFYTKGFQSLKMKIEKIIYAIKNWKFVKMEQKEIKREKKRKKIQLLMKLKNKTILETKNQKKENKKQNIILLPLIDYYYLNKNDNLIYKQSNPHPPIKKNNTYKFDKKELKKNESKSNENSRNIIKVILKSKKIEIKESKKIMKYNDDELNNLQYKEALKKDKRGYWQYYISLLKTKHPLLFTFFTNNDYNSKIVKIDLFFLGFTICFAVNAVFFNDETMHKIYEEEGSFNFVYQLPQIAYSFLISVVLNTVLNLLALSEGLIIKFKKDKKKQKLEEKNEKLNSILQIKFIIYFILGYILLIFFGYYLSTFCAVYRNTQIHLVKDTLISFGLSFIYPLFIYLVPGIFRIPSLANPKKKRNILYFISLLLQML